MSIFGNDAYGATALGVTQHELDEFKKGANPILTADSRWKRGSIPFGPVRETPTFNAANPTTCDAVRFLYAAKQSPMPMYSSVIVKACNSSVAQGMQPAVTQLQTANQISQQQVQQQQSQPQWWQVLVPGAPGVQAAQNLLSPAPTTPLTATNQTATAARAAHVRALQPFVESFRSCANPVLEKNGYARLGGGEFNSADAGAALVDEVYAQCETSMEILNQARGLGMSFSKPKPIRTVQATLVPGQKDLPGGVYSAQVLALQRLVSQRLKAKGCQGVTEDGKLGAGTCGALKYLGEVIPTACTQFKEPYCGGALPGAYTPGPSAPASTLVPDQPSLPLDTPQAKIKRLLTTTNVIVGTSVAAAVILVTVAAVRKRKRASGRA